MRSVLAFGLLGFVGSTLLLSRIPRLRRPRLELRLADYAPGASAVDTGGPFSVASLRDAFWPSAMAATDALSRLFGVTEALERRLRRVHAPDDVGSFRARQIRWMAAAFGGATAAAVAVSLPPLPAILLVGGAPVLAFLVLEHRLAAASADWRRRIFLELPLVAEQLGMLLAAGRSLGVAVADLAARGRGCCAADLRRVVARMDQGLSEGQALQEWAELAEVEALDRLVAVFALNQETADLGRLVADEARHIRKDAHRELIETIERRTEQVWIPVTVAALVPGVLLMGVPFIDALRLFST